MSFKFVIAIIRPDALSALKVKLGSLHVRGMTVTKVNGFGGHPDFFAKNNLTERLKIEIFVEVSKLDALITAIMDIAHSDVPGAGIVAVMPVEKFLHVSTRSETLPDQP